jgi:hypothetical protein
MSDKPDTAKAEAVKPDKAATVTIAESALVAEVRRQHPEIADKLAALEELYGRLHPDAGGHRPLTAEEQKIQADNELTLDERQLAQAVEHGTYVAAAPIYVDGALAHSVGHPVPISNVERYGYEQTGHVRRVDGK